MGPWDSDLNAKAPRGQRWRSNLRAAHFALTLALFFLCARAYFWPHARQDAAGMVANIEMPMSAQDKVGVLELRLKRKERELEGTRAELKKASRELNEYKSAEQETHANKPVTKVEELEKKTAELEKRDKAMVAMIERMRKSIAKMSKEMIKVKFGDREPHRVKMVVAFPESMGLPEEGEIVIELASAELVPTGVLYFLSQVEAGLWNGCSFIRNAGHVLQASPQSKSGEYLHRRFKELPHQGSSIPFQEYSEKFPHVKYSVGLAGRPGGPDFYISTVDNTRNHGPGGQSSYDLVDEADTCFGKVTEGFDVVDRLHRAPKKNDHFESMKERIEIRSLTII